MQQPQTPLELALASYGQQQHIHARDRSSIRKLAEDFGVSRSTLSNRLRGLTNSYSTAHSYRQALTHDEESCLVDYIRRSSLLGHPPPPYMVYQVADEIRRNRFLIKPSPNPLPLPNHPPLGRNWLDKFRGRHPQVASVWSRQLDTSRLDAATPEKLAPWFAEMGTILDRNRYKPENIFNMDETGHGIGTTQSTRCLVIRDAESGKGKGKKATKGTLGRQEWVTTVECVSAAGKSLPPLVIFKATGSFNTRWLPEQLEVQGWSGTTSNTGWTNDTLAYDWLERVFQPCTAPTTITTPPQRRLLIVDGHGSRVKARFIAFCMNHAIDLMVLPSHTSHITQPLDVSIFGPLKATMARATDRAATYDSGRISKADWASTLATARTTAMTEHNVRVGWKNTGLHPFNPQRILNTVPTPFTPTRQVRPLSRTPLASLTCENMDFLQSCTPSLLTPVKNRITSLVSAVETANARNTVLELENKHLRDAGEARKRKRAGITVGNLGTHVFTTEQCLEKVRDAEAATTARKRKGKDKAVPVGSPDLPEDVHTVLESMDWDMQAGDPFGE